MQENLANAPDEATAVIAPYAGNPAEMTNNAADWLYPGPLSRAITAAIMFVNLAQCSTTDCSTCLGASCNASGNTPGSPNDSDMSERTIHPVDHRPRF